jgi:single-stranded-DNA-specific exonuclease
MVLSELVKNLLEKRGITTDEDKQAFLSPDFELHTHDPFLLKDMDVAVARLFRAMDAGERIAIYADYDCDGIPGASVLHDFFTKIGYKNFEVYLPHRDREGYGFHIKAIDTLHGRGVTLIITVDVGTKAFEGIDHARKLGIDVIVTDHHEIDSELPAAAALLNPKRAPYPFSGLCGAAMAWKLVQAMLIEGRKRGAPSFAAIPVGWEKWFLDLVAIATIADLVPLVGENRVLAYWGLRVLRKTPRVGIVALCTQLRLRKPEIDEGTIGFSFAPRINAASRMDSPELALRLLTTADKDEAHELARTLESLNNSRKGVVAGIVKEAKRKVSERFSATDIVTVLGNPAWKPSLLGLAANSIMEERGGVVLLWGRDAEGKLKGSARSDGSLSVVELFSKTVGVFEEYGGHHASGGFTLTANAAHTLPEVLRSVAAQLESPEALQISTHDAVLSMREISSVLLRDLEQLAPFGMENPKPIFRISRVRVTSVRRFGKDSNHTEITLVCPETGMRHRAFQFFKAPEHFSTAPTVDALVDVLVTVEKDMYRGVGSIALRMVDILHP